MRLRIAMALAILAIVFAGGYAVFELVFANRAEVAASDRSRAPVEGLLPEPAADGLRAHVASVHGRVEVRRGTSGWEPLALGSVLTEEDSIRTAEDGQLTLSIAEHLEVEIPGRSALTIAALTRRISRLQLEDGRLGAHISGQPEARVEVAVAGTDAVVSADEGHFKVLRANRGAVTVAALSGTANFVASGKRVELHSGQQSTALPDAPPSGPSAIASTLFLKVKKPESAGQIISVSGRTVPGAMVSVAETPATLDEKGRFSASLPSPSVGKAIRVEAVDVLGRQVSQELRIDAGRPPRVKSKVEW